MIGKMVGVPSAAVGFAVHLIISAVIGAGFAILFGAAVRGPGSGIGYGLLYGAVWWLLGPLTLMPLFMGMGLGHNWSIAAMGNMLPSLMGHLIFGAVAGFDFGWLKNRAKSGSGTTRLATATN
jgi:uncharacterized membrane protein YagU involved in acid resistance